MQADEQLVLRIRRYGDKKAADELFERYYREIYAYVYRQCGHHRFHDLHDIFPGDKIPQQIRIVRESG